MWRIFALPGGHSLGTFLANVVEPRQGKARRIYPLRAWMHEVRTDA
jgi:hypothetical protein